jgi:hypothetical protein
VRQHLDRLERRNIAVDAIFLIGAAIDEIKAEARHAPPRAGAQVIDGRIALTQSRCSAVFGLFSLTSIDHCFLPGRNNTRAPSINGRCREAPATFLLC